MQGSFRAAFVIVVGVVGASGGFVVSTLLTEQVPDAVIVASGALGALALALAFAGMRWVPRLWADARREVVAVTACGAVAFAGAPMLALSQRASDAPPGTEAVFFSASAWALIVILLAAVPRLRDHGAAMVSGAILAAVGGAAILSNWERPSSFSPFVRFPRQHLLMLLAGVLFAVAVIQLVKFARRIPPTHTAVLATAGASLLALAALVPALSTGFEPIGATWPMLVFQGVFTALFVSAWIRLSMTGGAPKAAVVLLLVPAGLTTLSALERVMSVYGPDPIRWPAAVAGIVLCGLGGLVVWVASREGSPPPSVRSRGALQWAAVTAAVCATGALLTPALTADVAGAFGEEYRATWKMLGGESAVGWLVFSAGMLVLASVTSLRRGDRRIALVTAVSAILSGLAYPFLADTPFRTATLWIPADVQQTLGTEYARLTFEPVLDGLRMLSLVLAGVVAVGVIVSARRTGDRGRLQEGIE